MSSVMLVGGSNSILLPFSLTSSETDVQGGCETCSSSFRDGRGEIIIMQMPCCGEEESKQQMSGTTPPGKSISSARYVRAIEYKVGSEMKHGPGTSCISSRGFQASYRAEEVAEFFHSLATPTGAADCASQPTAAHLCFFL